MKKSNHVRYERIQVRFMFIVRPSNRFVFCEACTPYYGQTVTVYENKEKNIKSLLSNDLSFALLNKNIA